MIATAGLLLRLEYLRQFSNEVYFPFAIGADVQEYDSRAREILFGLYFPESPEIHGPLYSWFVALIYKFTGGSVVILRGIQILLNWGAYTAIAWMLKKFFGASEKLQYAFLGAAMFVPVLFFHHGELISESLSAPLFALFLWSWHAAEKKSKSSGFAGCGFILGLMILNHGIMLAFAAAETFRELWRRRYLRAGMLLAGIALAVAPVIALKSIFYERPTGIQANSAFNFWIGCNPDATGGCYLRPGDEWSDALSDGRRAAAANGISENREFFNRSGRFILDQPGKALLLPLKKALLLCAPWEPVAGADPEALIRRTPLQYYSAGLFAALLLLGAVGIFFAVKKRESAYTHFYLLGASVTLMLLLTVVSGRYRQNLMPALILLAAIGIVSFGKKSLAVIVPALILGIIFPFSRFPSIWQETEAASIEGEAFYITGNLSEAKRCLLIAETDDRNSARYDNLLGAIAEKEGDFAEAWRRYARAVQNNPQDADSLLNLAHLFFFHFPERRQHALFLIRSALEQNPALPSAYNMLGIHFAEQRNLPLALEMFQLALQYEPQNELYQNKVNLCRQILAQEREQNAPESSDR